MNKNELYALDRILNELWGKSEDDYNKTPEGIGKRHNHIYVDLKILNDLCHKEKIKRQYRCGCNRCKLSI